MLKVSVCPAVAEDAAAIAALNQSCFGAAYPQQKVANELRRILGLSGERVWVAVYRGEPVGYVHASSSFRTYRAERKSVRTLAVAKEYRRMGVGTALWQAVEAWAKAEGAEAVTAELNSHAGAQFCLALGCTETAGVHRFVRGLERN